MTVAVLALIGLAVLALLGRGLVWAYVPHRQLPGNRVRHNRLRLRLRLHPGRGHATVFALWLHWGRFAAFRSSGRTRRSLSIRQRIAAGSLAYCIVVGRAHHRHGVRVPLEEHVLVMAPPRSGKTGWLARVIIHYPGPVLSTTTRPDVYALTSGLRSRRGPIAVFNPQGIGGITATSTFRWSPVEGCEDRAVAIRQGGRLRQRPAAGRRKQVLSDLRAGLPAGDVPRGRARRRRHAARGAVGKDRHQGRRARGRGNPAQHGAPDWANELAQLRGKAEKTNATNEMVMGQMIGFMADPALAEAVLPAGTTWTWPRSCASPERCT